MIRPLALLIFAAALLGGCGPEDTPSTLELTLLLRAGPVCPVEQVPPNPACEPRPVADAVVAILEGDREVARGASDAFGRIVFVLPYGRYLVRPISEGGFPRPPANQLVDLGPQPAGVEGLELELVYDTGIR